MDSLTEMMRGWVDGEEAAQRETTPGAIFYGSAGSLRNAGRGDGYGKDAYSCGWRAGYASHVGGLPNAIVTDKNGRIV